MAKYIAKGMTEMCLMLQTPAGPWRVDFTGGLISGYGCAPASFSTDDRVLTQGAITQNPGWKDGLNF